MASKDLPTVIDYIKQNTSVSQIYYTGHSQGTMIAFAGFSKNQELAKSIKKFYGLAPVAYLGNMKSPLKYLASVTPELKVNNILVIFCTKFEYYYLFYCCSLSQQQQQPIWICNILY